MMTTVDEKLTCLQAAAQFGHVAIVEFLLAQSCSDQLLFMNPEAGGTCLCLASQGGHIEVVKLLVKAGGKRLLLTVSGADRISCLHTACQHGHLGIAKVLLEAGGEELLLLPGKKRALLLGVGVACRAHGCCGAADRPTQQQSARTDDKR